MIFAHNFSCSLADHLNLKEEVSRQIARLFKDAPDLRADFRVFLPEQSRQLVDESPPRASQTGTPLNEARNKRKLDAVASSMSLPPKRKRRAPEKETVPPKPVQVIAVSTDVLLILHSDLIEEA
jgi:paired amphipathic helix protein Sin3a